MPSNELRFRRLLEKLPAAAYTCDAGGLITYFNQHAVEIWGRAPKLNDPADRFCGSFKLYAEDGSPLLHDQCWMALALRQNKEYNGCEIVIERQDGRRVTALAHANPIHDDTGKLIGAVNVLVDISSRKQAEEALKKGDRAKNEFLATLAHELRNPLAPIRNAMQMIQLSQSGSPELEWPIGVIDRQLKQMTRLIDDLLDIARITGNKLELRKERVALVEVLNIALETSRPLIEGFGHEFSISLPKEQVWLQADATRLAQVVANLLNNAAKYTEKGGCIQLAVERQGSDVVIAVKDTGIGISGEMLPHIFEMFMQATESERHTRGGLGIGLTLVKRLVNMHGGTITARSEGPGKGSEFTLRMPIGADRPTQQGQNFQRRQTEKNRSLRILVVDDNADAVHSLARLLATMGHEVHCAHSGTDAVELVEKLRPRVALLDIGLPDLNGFDAARAIRQRPGGVDVVLIATTGWGQGSDRERSRKAGFDHHLVKPVDPDDLLAILDSVPAALAVPLPNA
ncbi:MAG TPA: ATP-binding protein [Pirellulaceae bacterium]|nr:ATP-binding protein [Pirellulaceae bacterium]